MNNYGSVDLATIYPDFAYMLVYKDLMDRQKPRVNTAELKKLYNIATGDPEVVENIWGGNISRATHFMQQVVSFCCDSITSNERDVKSPARWFLNPVIFDPEALGLFRPFAAPKDLDILLRRASIMKLPNESLSGGLETIACLPRALLPKVDSPYR